MRHRGGDRQRELYQYPPRIDDTQLPKNIRDMLPEDKTIYVKVKIPKLEGFPDEGMEFRLECGFTGSFDGLMYRLLLK